jgi:lipopolysaccharide/colanic/teichoic acid biosynthesis glycosyltransferase
MYKIIKNIFDIIMSFFLICLSSPLFIILYLLVYVKVGSPVIFKQKRPGYNGKLFTFYKFRTMLNINNEKGEPLTDEERLIPFGKFLRKYSLDELPSFFNVLKFEMSIVGPRPLMIAYLQLYSTEQYRRHEVKPGITGWAQINGRNSINWDEKLKLDVWYVDNKSILLDLKIILITFLKVIKADDISHAHHPTMPPFKGSK